tara:strand:+ start:475 stop:897 length:423 start_codon:yes stop_codon:yes gene_type:complete
MHVGVRASIYSKEDLKDDEEFGFKIIRAEEFDEVGGAKAIAKRILERVGDAPMYISVDIDVLDPAFAPGTGTPEAGGLTSRELLNCIRLLHAANVVGGDVMEVSPSYDHGEVTSMAASAVCYEILCLFALGSQSTSKSVK